MPGKVEADNAPERRGVYLLTHPRSASNLFQTMMSKQPGYQNSGYKLFEAGFATLGQLQRGPLSEWPEEDRKALYDKFTEGWESLQDEVADANKKGLQAFIKEHTIFLSGPDKCYTNLYPHDTQLAPLSLHERSQPPSCAHTNPTNLPDSFLLSMQPIFQIRHPALMFPSMFRTMRQGAMGADAHTTHPMITAVLTLQHSRALYDWYLTHASASMPPCVIDADDIMNSPSTITLLCERTGLSAADVQYEWDQREERDPLKAAFLSTIYASKGIVQGKDASGLDVEREKEKWVEEFGEEDATGMERFVAGAMGDYEYLLKRRVKGN